MLLKNRWTFSTSDRVTYLLFWLRDLSAVFIRTWWRVSLLFTLFRDEKTDQVYFSCRHSTVDRLSVYTVSTDDRPTVTRTSAICQFVYICRKSCRVDTWSEIIHSAFQTKADESEFSQSTSYWISIQSIRATRWNAHLIVFQISHIRILRDWVT